MASRWCHQVSSVSKQTGVNNTLHKDAPSSNLNNLTHIICNTDLLRSADKTVNTKFALINNRSVRNKADFIKDYIVEHHIDIVALTETWLSHDDKAEINVLPAGGYNLCHLPRRNHRGGGIGLLFKSTFNMISETPLTTNILEGLSVALQCPETDSNVRIYVIYRPPSSSLSRDFLDDFGATLSSAATHTNESIICGDFNVHYGNINSICAMNLATLIDNAGFVQHVTSATHLIGNTLDLLITPRASTLLSTPGRPTTLLTDHHVLECDLTVLKPTRLTRRVCYRKYSSIDKRAFATDVYNAFAGTTVGLIENYNAAIATVVDRHAPIVTRVVTVRPKTPWLTEELSGAKRNLHRAERRWRKTRLAVHRQMYTTLRDAYRRQLTTTKASHFCTVIHEAGHNMKTMFGFTNVLLGRSTPVQLPDSRIDLVLAETFHQFFIDKILNIRRAICAVIVAHSCVVIETHSCVVIVAYSCVVIVAHSCVVIVAQSCVVMVAHSCVVIVAHSCVVIAAHSCVGMFQGIETYQHTSDQYILITYTFFSVKLQFGNW